MESEIKVYYINDDPDNPSNDPEAANKNVLVRDILLNIAVLRNKTLIDSVMHQFNAGWK